jgi:hypothetical protein
MDAVVLSLTILLIFMTVILLLGVVYSRVHWSVKAGIIALTLVTTVIGYKTFVDARGYAVSMNRAPAQFQLLQFVIREAIGGDPGSIHLWIRALEESVPRAIRIPYSRENHEILNEARAQLEQGREVFMGVGGDTEGPPASSEGADGVAGQEGGGGTGGPQINDRMDFIRPPDTIPPKPQ